MPTLNYDTEMVAEWFKSSPYFRPPKNLGPGNWPPFPPLSYMTAIFREHWVLMNDAFCQQSATSVLSPTRPKIVCLHMPYVDGVDGNEGAGEAQPEGEGQQGDSQNVAGGLPECGRLPYDLHG